MNILIVEDEQFSAQHLKSMLLEIQSDAHIYGPLDSIRSIVGWFESNPSPDLAFFDIQLADGLSFEVFEQANIQCPVIFTTAFDEYAIKAFKLNSIDYLLKPVHFIELKAAIDKYKRIYQPIKDLQPTKKMIEQLLADIGQSYKTRFSVRVGEHLLSIRNEDIAYFHAEQKSTYLSTTAGRNYDLDYSLDQLDKLLDPKLFFRISRKYIIHIDAIKDIIVFSGSRLRIKVAHEPENELIVSREKVKFFREWLDA